MSNQKNEMTAGGALIGYQMPLGTRRKLEAFMEALNLLESDRQLFFMHVSKACAESISKNLDEGKMLEASKIVVDKIEENLIRSLIREKLREVVRKKKGGAGYALYSPNQGKKKPPKSVGEFPTKLQAKRAELQRFPPKDMSKLKRLRHEVERLQKDPKKAKEKESEWAGKKKDVASKKRDDKAKAKKESLQLVKSFVMQTMNEALFREEEDAGSRWDERMVKLSKAALEADKKLQSLQKNIEKKGESTISTAFQIIQKTLKPRKMQAKSDGIKKDQSRQKTFLQFTITVDMTDVGPFYIFVENGKPKIEMSDEAKKLLMKIEAEKAKLLRAELITAQEDSLDIMSDIQDAVEKRDTYLDKLESRVDDFVSGLNATELTVLKNLLVQKYRGR